MGSLYQQTSPVKVYCTGIDEILNGIIHCRFGIKKIPLQKVIQTQKKVNVSWGKVCWSRSMVDEKESLAAIPAFVLNFANVCCAATGRALSCRSNSQEQFISLGCLTVGFSIIICNSW